MITANIIKSLELEQIEGFDTHLEAPKPVGNYIAVTIQDNIAFVSGQMPKKSTGEFLSENEHDSYLQSGYKAAELAMANALLQLAQNKRIIQVEHIVRLDGYFKTTNGELLAGMLNGASDLIKTVFGINAAHARTVFGVSSLPGNALVEIVVIAKVKTN